MIYTYNYDTNYDPAFPVAEINISRTSTSQPITLTALIDSGSDATMIPIQHLKQIQARKGGQQQLRGVAGISYTVDMYRVFVTIGEFHTWATAVADHQNQQTILGRDVLNQLIVTLNGLAFVTEIQP